jgi:hypothetical protein
MMHSGIRQTLVTLRERFWVLRGREAVKINLRKCIICQKHEGIAFKPPSAPDFPTERVSMEPPFTFTGLDFAGPLYVRSEKEKQSIRLFVYMCINPGSPLGADTVSKCSIISDGISPFC